MSETKQFVYVPEQFDQFLKLFPHRYDYIWAKHPRPGEKPEWQSEKKHPLSDRMIQDGSYLYGVRFGPQTEYLMLDIDRDSIYHPKRDPLAAGRIVEALEPLGLTDFLAVSSSYNAGVHLYFPWEGPVSSWKVAAAVNYLLNKAGFIIDKGLLETFPNVKNYDPEGPTLFNGHRLPLQPGSYLCSKHFELIPGDREKFAATWAWCQYRNTIHEGALERLVKMATRPYRRMSYRAEKFLNDLNTCIEEGWTGHGQTNYLLGRVTLRAYCFGHIAQGGEPLTGDRLVQEIVAIATQLPGYKEWCRHQPEIWRRAEDWARCAENSHYFPYRVGKSKGTSDAPPPPSIITWNQFLQRRARERLCFAIADLLNRGTLPAGTSERFRILTQEYGFSGETLYHHRDLWHPEHLWKTPPEPPHTNSAWGGGSVVGAPPPQQRRSLLGKKARKPLQDEDVNPFWEGWKLDVGCNTPSHEGFSDRGGGKAVNGE